MCNNIALIIFRILINISFINKAISQSQSSSPVILHASESISSSAKQQNTFKCPEQFGYFRDTTDCGKYYICSFGISLHKTCSPGLQFSAVLQTCDWPINVLCGTSEKGAVDSVFALVDDDDQRTYNYNNYNNNQPYKPTLVTQKLTQTRNNDGLNRESITISATNEPDIATQSQTTSTTTPTTTTTTKKPKLKYDQFFIGDRRSNLRLETNDYETSSDADAPITVNIDGFDVPLTEEMFGSNQRLAYAMATQTPLLSRIFAHNNNYFRSLNARPSITLKPTEKPSTQVLSSISDGQLNSATTISPIIYEYSDVKPEENGESSYDKPVGEYDTYEAPVSYVTEEIATNDGKQMRNDSIRVTENYTENITDSGVEVLENLMNSNNKENSDQIIGDTNNSDRNSDDVCQYCDYEDVNNTETGDQSDDIVVESDIITDPPKLSNNYITNYKFDNENSLSKTTLRPINTIIITTTTPLSTSTIAKPTKSLPNMIRPQPYNAFNKHNEHNSKYEEFKAITNGINRTDDGIISLNNRSHIFIFVKPIKDGERLLERLRKLRHEELNGKIPDSSASAKSAETEDQNANNVRVVRKQKLKPSFQSFINTASLLGSNSNIVKIDEIMLTNMTTNRAHTSPIPDPSGERSAYQTQHSRQQQHLNNEPKNSLVSTTQPSANINYVSNNEHINRYRIIGANNNNIISINKSEIISDNSLGKQALNDRDDAILIENNNLKAIEINDTNADNRGINLQFMMHYNIRPQDYSNQRTLTQQQASNQRTVTIESPNAIQKPLKPQHINQSYNTNRNSNAPQNQRAVKLEFMTYQQGFIPMVNGPHYKDSVSHNKPRRYQQNQSYTTSKPNAYIPTNKPETRYYTATTTLSPKTSIQYSDSNVKYTDINQHTANELLKSAKQPNPMTYATKSPIAVTDPSDSLTTRQTMQRYDTTTKYMDESQGIRENKRKHSVKPIRILDINKPLKTGISFQYEMFPNKPTVAKPTETVTYKPLLVTKPTETSVDNTDYTEKLNDIKLVSLKDSFTDTRQAIVIDYAAIHGRKNSYIDFLGLVNSPQINPKAIKIIEVPLVTTPTSTTTITTTIPTQTTQKPSTIPKRYIVNSYPNPTSNTNRSNSYHRVKPLSISPQIFVYDLYKQSNPTNPTIRPAVLPKPTESTRKFNEELPITTTTTYQKHYTYETQTTQSPTTTQILTTFTTELTTSASSATTPTTTTTTENYHKEEFSYPQTQTVLTLKPYRGASSTTTSTTTTNSPVEEVTHPQTQTVLTMKPYRGRVKPRQKSGYKPLIFNDYDQNYEKTYEINYNRNNEELNNENKFRDKFNNPYEQDISLQNIQYNNNNDNNDNNNIENSNSSEALSDAYEYLTTTPLPYTDDTTQYQTTTTTTTESESLPVLFYPKIKRKRLRYRYRPTTTWPTTTTIPTTITTTTPTTTTTTTTTAATTITSPYTTSAPIIYEYEYEELISDTPNITSTEKTDDLLRKLYEYITAKEQPIETTEVNNLTLTTASTPQPYIYYDYEYGFENIVNNSNSNSNHSDSENIELSGIFPNEEELEIVSVNSTASLLSITTPQSSTTKDLSTETDSTDTTRKPRPTNRRLIVKDTSRMPSKPASRPRSVFPTPRPLITASKCDIKRCKLPDCRCGGTDIPGGLNNTSIPQIVLITFDDAVNDLNWEIYEEIFGDKYNPNGCPIRGTFYVSHEWTDYGQVQTLYSMGHEIASHGITHSFGEKFTKQEWIAEINGQREILHLYGGVKLEDIRGMRAPFLQTGGNPMFQMLYETNFTYDSSLPVFDSNPPFFPYTLDYALNHDCMISPCPSKSFPGVWEVGMTMWQDLRGGRCSMGDACTNPSDELGVYDMLLKNFNRHYKSNRAPFGLFYHSAWFNTQHHRKGFMRFMDEIILKDDVYFITNWQLIQWMRDPTPLDKIFEFEPWKCDNDTEHYQNNKPCNHATVCNVNAKNGARQLRTCQPCPSSYPWIGNTGLSARRG